MTLICIADRFPSAQNAYRDADQWLAALCGVLSIELQRAGASGALIIGADLTRRGDGSLDAVVTVAPGRDPLTCDRLREFMARDGKRVRTQDADLHRRPAA